MEKFPFSDYINATVTLFDSRGLNVCRDAHHCTVNIIHGNPIPILKPLHTKMLAMMGVDIEVGRAAIEHESFIEPMAQHIARTSIRNGIEGERIFVALPTINVAKQIEEALQIDCELDLSIMLDIPEKAPAPVKRKNAERDQVIKDLLSKNHTHKKIADTVGCSTRTVQRVQKKVA
ncbi:helix-turn-helix domain-containing protein [Vreelandella titanicae]|uniref:helix-turn-helix domain-containing protein n=1 Tax=Vreelandella titanicae TaxID=664683 RepID=UPI0038188494